MSKTTRYIILGIIAILVVIVLAAGATYAFMKPQLVENAVTEVSLSSCAKISLKGESSIDLNNTYPMSKNQALKTTPYNFTVSSSCPGNVGYNLYLGTLNTNTLDARNIRYIITKKGTKEIVKEGIVGNETDIKSSFNDQEITEYNVGMGGTLGSVYLLFNEPLTSSVTYDLYLYVDGTVTDSNTMNKTFIAGIAVKAYNIGE